MSTQNIVRCDFCGKQKQEVNHWFRVTVQLRTFMVNAAEDGLAGLDACGQECVVKALSRFLDHGDLSERKAEAVNGQS